MSQCQWGGHFHQQWSPSVDHGSLKQDAIYCSVGAKRLIQCYFTSLPNTIANTMIMGA